MTFPTNLAQDNSSDAATERGEAWTSSTIRYQNMLLKACIMQLCATLCPGPSAAGKQLSRCLSENRYVACSEVETLLSSPACATRPFEVASRVSHSSTWCSQPASQPASKPASHSSSGTPQNSPNNPKFKTIMPSTKKRACTAIIDKRSSWVCQRQNSMLCTQKTLWLPSCTLANDASCFCLLQ